ncbi:uncharacterized protein N7500_002775 [Penicillium coprophilum]|uniref:uncharacterized protein n=1 Tax=Penicillium coprophilum TaxID=36646 RepID=UPI00238EC518|nr:uncharacterized protein N7500_002775 [Penicillium coprophilum]KAJ5169992.1 hypothetical protein N7500_002775 [Penicillium coprophilum]
MEVIIQVRSGASMATAQQRSNDLLRASVVQREMCRRMSPVLSTIQEIFLVQNLIGGANDAGCERAT